MSPISFSPFAEIVPTWATSSLVFTFLEEEEMDKSIVYPPKQKIFEAFRVTPYNKVKVVIVGQDPYHGEGQANGLCFSVNKGQSIPPSLKNIYKELCIYCLTKKT